ncbi:cysteine desulfurase [Alkalimonas collagenimarina]|uniref:cysteine desulfurase n=1 Tax=Alkalimonas collagenimarina TaxID=400390 RepID=A0ABT9H0V1_9GAMM|nr:cysteine desulfurase [Alkalimonas collagenimarina]MDP4536941.1 cysteine desulfurase [Alkalimonas collagenimarina]
MTLAVAFNVETFRQQFPFFQANPNWVYLDNAATSHKPQIMLDSLQHFYASANSNIHRGAHSLGDQATQLYEQARQHVADFIGAEQAEQIIFTSGTTAALNQLAFGLMGTVLQPGDRILLTTLEHHANIVPWQLHCQSKGVVLDVVPLTVDHQLDMAAFSRLLQHQPKVVSFCHVSNVLGQVLPVADMVQQAQAVGALTVIDGAQGILHDTIDVQQLNTDFYVFSGHKIYGPTGVGVLYGKTKALECLTPLLGGGEMIQHVSFDHTRYHQLPFRLEAGTSAIAEVIALGTTLHWLAKQDRTGMRQHKQQLLQHGWQQLEAMPQLELLSSATNNAGIITFNVRGEHPTDVATLLNEQKIAVRAGQHCAMPLFANIHHPGAVRLSLAAYTTQAEVDAAINAIRMAVELLCPS